MTDPKDNSNEKRENIFEILDGIMIQLSRTKKIFMIMILTTLIIPPIALLVMTSVYDTPWQERFEQRLEERLQERLQSGEITEDQYHDIKQRLTDRERPNLLLRPPQIIIFAISLVWLGIGIRQWIALSKWDKKYQQFKKKQDDVDKKLDDSEKDE